MKCINNVLLTLLNDFNDIISIEAELICVLSIIGVQGFTLGHLRFRFGRRFRSSSSWRRPAGRRSVSSGKKQPDSNNQYCLSVVE